MLALGSAVACSSSDDDKSTGSNQTGSEQPGTASADITAADGGDVALGAAKLSIPGGALDDDTTVTVASSKPSSDLPDASSVQGLVYDFGPTGTTFNAPVALTLPATAPGTGKEAVIAYLDETTNSWQDLDTAAVKNGTVTTEITHFSTYVVRIRNTSVDTGGGAVDCSFTACGGDPTGVWKVADACISGDGAGPFGDQCPDGTFDINLNAGGSLTIENGRYTWDLTLSGSASIDIPADCIDAIGGGQIKACTDFEDSGSGWTCSGGLTTKCSCDVPIDSSTETSSGTLEVKGTQAIGTPDGDTAGTPSDFCVSGNTLKIMQHDTNSDGTTQDTLLVFTK
jgi:hypothetical protein